VLQFSDLVPRRRRRTTSGSPAPKRTWPGRRSRSNRWNWFCAHERRRTQGFDFIGGERPEACRHRLAIVPGAADVVEHGGDVVVAQSLPRRHGAGVVATVDADLALEAEQQHLSDTSAGLGRSGKGPTRAEKHRPRLCRPPGDRRHSWLRRRAMQHPRPPRRFAPARAMRLRRSPPAAGPQRGRRGGKGGRSVVASFIFAAWRRRTRPNRRRGCRSPAPGWRANARGWTRCRRQRPHTADPLPSR
jgi:hypothetical protein